MNTERVYISGPITNVDDYAERFAAAESALRAAGHRVVNPARKLHDGWTWHDYMRRDLRYLALCTAIHMLAGWPQSAGARVELIHALDWGLKWLR